MAAVAMAGVAAGLVACGTARWRRRTRLLLQRLAAARRPASIARYDERELDGLPAPVQRYFRAVLQDGQPVIGAATIELAGHINLSATAERWQPFNSRQRVVTRCPGFLWDARIAMLPGVALRIVDGYIAGEGLLQVAAMGLFTLAGMQGRGELARGELMRYFAEMAWYPTALLPSQGVRWQAIDERSANATLVDGPLAITLLFSFDDAGLIASARAEARGAMVGKTMVMLPWEGRWSGYEWRDGIRVPTCGEAAWGAAQGRRTYFRGTVTSLNWEFAP